MATHTLVVGPGAIGCLLASHLIRADQRVTLLDRDPARARRISQTGIQVEGLAGFLPVSATTNAAEVNPVDLILLCVKSYDTAAAVKHMTPACRTGTRVVSLQNGLGNLECVSGQLPSATIIASATFHGASLIGVAHVRHAASGHTFLAPMRSGQACDDTVAFFNDAGIDASHFDDWEALLWSKLVVNAAINPITAMHGIPNGHVLAREDLTQQLHAAAMEVARVASARGLRLMYDDVRNEVDRACRETGSNHSSMLQDILRARRTEIEAINGAVVEQAGRLNIPVPVNHELLDAVRKLEKDTLSRASGQGPG